MPATKVRRKAQTHERRAEQQRRILAAVESLVAERSFRDLTVEDVMTTAGLSRTTFYRHFPDLESILLQGVADISEELRAASSLWLETSGDPDAALDPSGKGLVETYRRHGRLLLAFVEAAATAPEVEAAWQQTMDGFVDRACQRIVALNRSGRTHVVHPLPTARALVWMTERYLLETYGRHDSVPVKTSVETLVTIWRRTLFG